MRAHYRKVKMKNLANQLFNGLIALNLKQASALRPLTQSEKSLLEQTETKAGDTLYQMKKYVKNETHK